MLDACDAYAAAASTASFMRPLFSNACAMK